MLTLLKLTLSSIIKRTITLISKQYVYFKLGGYPANPGANPRNPGGISRDDCAVFPGFSHALCFAFRTDNSGPPQSLAELLGKTNV